MISNNELGRRTLVAPGGALDVLLCGTLEENNEITRRGIVDLDLQAVGLPRDIADRGVGSDVVPRYAYRDDGILLHGALNKYVTDYIETAYPTEVCRASLRMHYECLVGVTGQHRHTETSST